MVRCRWTGQLLYVMCELSEYSNDKSLPSLKRHLTRVFRRVAQHDRGPSGTSSMPLDTAKMLREILRAETSSADCTTS